MKKLSLELYKKMYLIRKAEEAIQKYYPEDEMKTPMHMSMGEESVVSGVVHALQPSDQVLGSYRSHALYLAKTGETDKFFAEMFGKETGMAQGKSGSMHLNAPDQGLLCCSAIVASSIPVAMGAAYANKYQKNNKIVAVFFGDGATDEGVFWETLNFSCLKKLPLMFVCEDNGYAVHTPRWQRQCFPNINKIVENYDCNVFEENSTDPELIYSLAKNALAKMNENGKPGFLRLHYYRYLEHVGINEDFDAGYRPISEFHEWQKKDPVNLQRKKLETIGYSAREIQTLEKDIEDKIEHSIHFARSSKLSDVSELYRGVFI